MNQITTKSTAVALADVMLPTPAAQRGIEAHAWNALKQSVFPGASDHMVLLAVDYCKARRLDPLAKPVHIVKTYDTEKGAYVESVWPGVNLHRTTASRTGDYAGQDRPAFGPDVTRKLGAAEFTFPEWCEVTVHKMVRGQKVAYTGLVYFLETYASVKDGGPNRMWRKRPRGQLAKCAEAEALRKAFPEETGGGETAEEMEGQAVGPERARDITPAAEPAKPTRLGALEEIIGTPNPWNEETGEITESAKAPASEPTADAGQDRPPQAAHPADPASEILADAATDDPSALLAACTTITALKELYFQGALKDWKTPEAQRLYNDNFDRIKGARK